MLDIQDYRSSLTDAASRKLGTFSYLPEMDEARIRAQVRYIVSRGWNPGIEHVDPEHAFDHYWYMWKLPMFGEQDVDRILAELRACRRAYPANHVRLVAYDNYAQTKGAEMVVYRGNGDRDPDQDRAR